MEEKQSSEALRQQITDTRTRIAQLTNELALIERSIDEQARAQAVDHRAVSALQKRRTAAAGEVDFLEKRSAALEGAHQQAQAIQAAERLAEIEREHAELLTHAELLMATIAQACATIVAALAELKPLIRQGERLENERAFWALKYRLHSSPLQRVPQPGKDFLRPLEKAREALSVFGADEWQRKTAALREAQRTATHRAGEDTRPAVGATVTAGGTHYTPRMWERDEEKAREFQQPTRAHEE
jgi:hypothetical protein